MARKRKKKPPEDAASQGKMLPDASGPAKPEGTRIDDAGRHVYFSFKGELKSDLPDATETDFAGKLGLPSDATATGDAMSLDKASATGDAAAKGDATATGETPAPAVPAEPDAGNGSESDETAHDVEPLPGPAEAAVHDETATRTGEEPAPVRETQEQKQQRAGPVRGPDPAAREKSASQSRMAAGPAHFTPPADDAPADSASTHTDVRGEPFTPPEEGATHTEIRANVPGAAAEPEPALDEATQTEFGEVAERPPVVPVKPLPQTAKRQPAPTIGDETGAKSETLLDAHALLKAREETAAGSETMLDGAAAPPAREETAAGSETLLDVGAGGLRGTAQPKPRAYAGPDAETLTKDPAATSTGGRPTATDLPYVAQDLFDLAPSAAADMSAEAEEAPSFHDAETASQEILEAAHEAAVPDLASDETQALDVSTDEAPPFAPAPTPSAEPAAPFAGPVFDAPAETSTEAPPKPPRIHRRRGQRPKKEPALKRLLGWVKRLDPRDFLEILGTAIFQRAQKLASRVRTARRENRVTHTPAWWRRTLTEMGILYAIVIPIELAVSGGRLGSYGIHPHPYWLVVLPFAAARGMVAGLLAAIVASILYGVGAAQAVTADVLFSFRTMTEPILFFAVSFFAGEMHDEAELKRRKLDRRIQDLEERTAQLRQQRDVLSDANRELEKRIVDDSVQFGNLIQAARRVERAGRQEVFDLALEMAEEHCGAAASVLLLLEDGSLDYLCHRGWSSEETGKRLAIARRSAFVKRAISEGVAVDGLDPSEVAPQEGPLVVAPLFDAGGVVRAILCLDEIPLARLNQSTVTVFLGIGEWASAALARLTRGGDTPAPRAAPLSVGPEVDHWLGTVPELSKRLRVELARCSRYGVPTSFLTVQATEWKDATREGVEALDRFILMHFTSGLRPSDGIYRFGYPGTYLLILAGTALEGAEVVRARLERRIAYTPSPVGAIEVAATGPDSDAPDLASLVARVAKGFRDRSKLPLDSRCPVEIAERIEAEDLNAFLRRLKLETSLAVRNGFDLHVVGISAEASEQAGPGILARHAVEVGAQTLRPTDGVYMIGQYQCAVVLPCTNGEEAATVAHRLAMLVRARDPKAPYGQIETQVLGLGTNHPDAGSFLTALARRVKKVGG